MEQQIAARSETMVDGLHPDIGSLDAVVAHVNEHSRRLCATSRQAWSLHSAAYDTDSLQHAVLARAGTGHWQYVALAGDGTLVAADPPLCSSSRRALSFAASRQRHAEGLQRKLFEQELAVDDQGHLSSGLGHPAEFTVGEDLTLLNPADDGLVNDCLTAIHKTAKELCKKDFEVKVQHAQLAIIDGMDVHLSATMADPKTGSRSAHDIHCFFQVPHTLEEKTNVKDSDFVPMADLDAKAQLTYQVAMSVDLCDAATSLPSTTQLFESHALGELSKYRGYRHVYDNVVRLFQNESLVAPAAVDLRTRYSKCFPNGGRDTVKNQGTCGSCWAMAVSTSLMSNMCIVASDGHTLETDWHRFEVSVQHIMSCNEQQLGCDGGYATAAEDSLQKHGIARMRDVPYLCGGGDATKHFELESATCASYPWGATCPKSDPKSNPHWHLEGVYSVSGEAEMKKALASGYSLYVTMLVPKSFEVYRKGIFVPGAKAADPIIGGHAVVCVGYGDLSGEPYWLMQNSWGEWWGEDGFFRLPRGSNTLSIEETALVFRGYSDGNKASLPAAPHNRVGGGFSLDALKYMPKEQRMAGLAALAVLVLLCGVCYYRKFCFGSSPQPQLTGYRGIGINGEGQDLDSLSRTRFERPMPKDSPPAVDDFLCCGCGPNV